MTAKATDTHNPTPATEPLALRLSERLGAWVRTDETLPPEGVEVFATGWAYQDPEQGRYFAVVVYQGNDDWANPCDLERSEHDGYRPTHWMLPPPVSA
jgi:hypothetical protein